MSELLDSLSTMPNLTVVRPWLVERELQMNFTRRQIDDLMSGLPSRERVEQITRRFCVLVPTPAQALNLFELAAALPQFMSIRSDAKWFHSQYQRFAHDQYLPAAKWVAIGLEAFLPTLHMPWSDQLDLLPFGMYVPQTVLSVYAKIMNRCAEDDPFTSSYMSRTSSVDADGNRVIVGPVEGDVIAIHKGDDHARALKLVLDVGMVLD